MNFSGVLRLFSVNSFRKLVPKKSNCQYKLSYNFIRLYRPNQHVSNPDPLINTCKRFISYNVFRSKTNCREIFTYNSSSSYGDYKKIIALSGLMSFFFNEEKEDEDKEPDLITMIKRGILSIQKEDYKTAEKILHVALRVAQEQQNADGVTYIYDLLANVAFELGEWEKAEKLFVNVMQRELSSGMAQDDMKIIHMSLKLAKIYESMNDDEKAEQGFQFCMKHLQERVDKSSEDLDVLTLWAMTLDWYARFLQDKNRMDEALEYYMKAHNMCVKLYGEIHEQNVILLNDIGTIMFLKGKKQDALEYMNKAVEIGKHLPNMTDLASVYINLGNIYLQKGMYAEAKKSCTEGFQNATRHNNPEGLKEAGICLDEVKKLYQK